MFTEILHESIISRGIFTIVTLHYGCSLSSFEENTEIFATVHDYIEHSNIYIFYILEVYLFTAKTWTITFLWHQLVTSIGLTIHLVLICILSSVMVLYVLYIALMREESA